MNRLENNNEDLPLPASEYWHIVLVFMDFKSASRLKGLCYELVSKCQGKERR